MRRISRILLSFRYRRSGRGKGRFRRLILVLAGLMAVWIGISEVGLVRLSRELTEEAARSYLLYSMNRAVNRQLEQEEQGFVSVNRSGNGQVTAVSANTDRLNALRSGVLESLEKSLNGRVTAYIPIGSLTNLRVLNGRGPKVPVKLQLESSADVSFQTEFTSAGVNQSCHRITMTVRAKTYSQSNQFEVGLEEETSTVLAETVVVGEVPDLAFMAG